MKAPKISDEERIVITTYEGATWQQLQVRVDCFSEYLTDEEISGLRQEIARLKEQEGGGPPGSIDALKVNKSQPMPVVDTIYTLEEAAEKLKMSVRNVRQWVNDGKIKAFKLGREWRIHEEDLQAVIDKARKG